MKEIIKVKGLVIIDWLCLPTTSLTCHTRYQVAPAELEDGLCTSPLVQDAGVTSIYDEEAATEYPIAYVVPFNKELLKGGRETDEFVRVLKALIESKYNSYKWSVFSASVFASLDQYLMSEWLKTGFEAVLWLLTKYQRVWQARSCVGH